jgi:hypothetical protein
MILKLKTNLFFPKIKIPRKNLNKSATCAKFAGKIRSLTGNEKNMKPKLCGKRFVFSNSHQARSASREGGTRPLKV